MREFHNPTLSVIVATYNRPRTILRLLNILNGQLRFNFNMLDVCIVEDGGDRIPFPDEWRTEVLSTHDLRESLSLHFKCTYVYNPRRPDGTSRVYGNRNIAAQTTNGEYVLQLDDDVTFHERSLSELQNMAALFDMLAPNLHWAMSPRISNNIDRETHMGNDRSGWHRGPDGLWRDGKVAITRTRWASCDSSMMFMPRRTWDEIGGYDEQFDGCMGAADQELALRVQKVGGLLMLGPYFANKEDEETNSWRGAMIDLRAQGRPYNEELMLAKHPDMDDWAKEEVDQWTQVFDLVGGTHVVKRREHTNSSI